MRRSYV